MIASNEFIFVYIIFPRTSVSLVQCVEQNISKNVLYEANCMQYQSLKLLAIEVSWKIKVRYLTLNS